MVKTVITYAYFESDSAKYNFDFFVKKELKFRHDVDYIIIVNGHSCSVSIPSLDNLTVIRRDNRGFDFGAYYESVVFMENNNLVYDYYVFLNAGVFGPVLPHYSNYFFMNFHWSTVFTSKITDRVKLVGTTIVCLPSSDLGGYGPKVEGFFFATDQIGLDIMKREGNIFQDHPDKKSAIVNGEYGMSRAIINNGFTLDCMLQAYQGVDWEDKANWNKNNHLHASRKGKYFGKSIDPYEVIFHKWKWIDSDKVNFDIIDQYRQFLKL